MLNPEKILSPWSYNVESEYNNAVIVRDAEDFIVCKINDHYTEDTCEPDIYDYCLDEAVKLGALIAVTPELLDTLTNLTKFHSANYKDTPKELEDAYSLLARLGVPY